MLKTFLSLMLTGLLTMSLNAAPVFAAQGNDNDAEKIKVKVAQLGVGDKTRVTVKMKGGTKLKGSITQAGANDFTVRDRKTGNATTILYSDVAKLDDNRGGSALRNTLIAVGVGVGIVIVGIGILIASLKD
jgi:hypothetical protein